jgi:hypothetical protein
VRRNADFELVGPITDIEVIATGRAIRSLKILRKAYGSGRWRKMKGRGTVRLRSGREVVAEIHWYEAHGIGKFEYKIKHIIEDA